MPVQTPAPFPPQTPVLAQITAHPPNPPKSQFRQCQSRHPPPPPPIPSPKKSHSIPPKSPKSQSRQVFQLTKISNEVYNCSADLTHPCLCDPRKNSDSVIGEEGFMIGSTRSRSYRCLLSIYILALFLAVAWPTAAAAQAPPGPPSPDQPTPKPTPPSTGPPGGIPTPRPTLRLTSTPTPDGNGDTTAPTSTPPTTPTPTTGSSAVAPRSP